MNGTRSKDSTNTFPIERKDGKKMNGMKQIIVVKDNTPYREMRTNTARYLFALHTKLSGGEWMEGKHTLALTFREADDDMMKSSAMSSVFKEVENYATTSTEAEIRPQIAYDIATGMGIIGPVGIGYIKDVFDKNYVTYDIY